MKQHKIINRIKCTHCGEIIVSNHRHDFKYCLCKTVAVDGGHAYLRRLRNDKFDYFELSERIEVDDGYTLVDKALKQKEFDSCCYFCKSKNILLYKGDGEYIYGLDFLGYKCDDCKKVYVFSDINFKVK